MTDADEPIDVQAVLGDDLLIEALRGGGADPDPSDLLAALLAAWIWTSRPDTDEQP